MEKVLDWRNKEVVSIYDELSLWSSFYGKLLLDNIPMKPQSTILDLGFGTGFPLIELAQRFGDESKVIGVDLWEEAIIRAKVKINLLGINNIEIIQNDVSNVSFEDDSIDLVCSNLGINNFSNRKKLFENISKMLKIGGHFCFTTTDQNTFIELFTIFKSVMDDLKISTSILESHISNRIHIHSLVKQVIKCNFQHLNTITETTFFRFTSSKALFSHSFIRVAFLSTWIKLVPEDVKDSFFSLVSLKIDEVINNNKEFILTIPLNYLCFKKVA